MNFGWVTWKYYTLPLLSENSLLKCNSKDNYTSRMFVRVTLTECNRLPESAGRRNVTFYEPTAGDWWSVRSYVPTV